MSNSILPSRVSDTFVAFVFGVVAKEYARGGSKLKFGFGVGSKIRIAKAPKWFKNGVVRCFVKKNLKGRLIVDYWRGNVIEHL